METILLEALRTIFIYVIVWKLLCFYSFHIAKGFRRRALTHFIKLTRRAFKQCFRSLIKLISKGTVFSIRKQNNKSNHELPNNVIPFPKAK